MPPLSPELQYTIRHQRLIHQPRPLPRILSEDEEATERRKVISKTQALVECHSRREMYEYDVQLADEPCNRWAVRCTEERRYMLLYTTDNGVGACVDGAAAG